MMLRPPTASFCPARFLRLGHPALLPTLCAAALSLSLSPTISAQETPVTTTPPAADSTATATAETPVAEAPARPRPTKPGELFPFVMPWDDASPGITNIASWHPTPAGRNGFVFTKDGHFYEPADAAGPTARLLAEKNGTTLDPDPRRLRLLGVNLCFAGNFPKKEDAPKIAARMARFGINCVRFHHMDMQHGRGGIFLDAELRELNPEQLDRLDFFIAELKKRGIYSNINLHVSRDYPGFPKRWEEGPSYHKGVDHFHPELIALQKEFAKDLLTHLNPYTQTRYIDEPAIVLVEINNENGLIFEWSGGKLDNMPEVFATELNRQWTNWLVNKYPAETGPDHPMGPASWQVKEVPPGEQLLNPISAPEAGTGADGTWYLEQHGNAVARLEQMTDPNESGNWTRLYVEAPGQESWHIQLSHRGLALSSETPYTLSFEARASDPVERIALLLSQAAEPWKPLATRDLTLTEQWRKHHVALTPEQAQDPVRVVISGLGKATAGTWVDLRKITLNAGGTMGVQLALPEGGFRFLKDVEFHQATLAQRQDWMEFIWETEDNYWREMQRYLAEELKVKSLVLGTQASVFSNAALQSRFPVIDTHSYWKHPMFPNQSWSTTEYRVDNVPMSERRDGGVLSRIGVNRVHGLPFIVTEYNHPNPNSYAAEAFPMLAAYAAWQDWDGIFPFAYSHDAHWNTGRINSFFDIKQDPLKMATMLMAAATFLRGDLMAPEEEVLGPVPPSAFRAAMLDGSTVIDATNFGVARETLNEKRFYIKIGDAPAEAAPGNATAAAEPEPAQGETLLPAFRYVKPAKGKHDLLLVTAPRSKAVIGHTQGEEFAMGDGVTISDVKTRLPENWAIITLNQMSEGESITGPGRNLILAMADQEGTGMKWVDEQKKDSVSNNWGKAPGLVSAVAATITLPVAKDRVQVWSLDERGQPIEALPITGSAEQAIIQLRPEYATIWYELVVQ